jgi:hypothetical protein
MSQSIHTKNGVPIVMEEETQFVNGLSFDSGSNVFNTFETGTFTPTFELAAGSTDTFDDVPAEIEGHYVRINNWVQIWGIYTYTNYTIVSGTAELYIASLPFTVSGSIFNLLITNASGVGYGGAANNEKKVLRLLPGTNKGIIVFDRDGAVNPSAASDANLNTTATNRAIYFSGSYLTS